ncbi:MAG: FemAB family XrtA/PEP-CTERM system-associated protein [Phycisphaerales bacterium JB063]
MIQQMSQLDPQLRFAIRRLLKDPAAAPRACGEHDPAWLDILCDGLRHRTTALVARRHGQVTGYLPLSLLRSPLFGRHLVSLPYVNRAGVVACDEGTAEELIHAATKLADRKDARYLELRHHGQSIAHEALSHTRDAKVRMVLPLPRTSDELWDGLKAKVRNQVRKGERHALSIRYGGEDLLSGFYSVFATTMRDLGTPVYPKRLFAAVLHHLGAKAELALVSLEGSPVAGALLIHEDTLGERETQVPSACCLHTMHATCANMWMYRQLIDRAIARGAEAFDFGRSSVDSGTYRFKRQWGAQAHATPWQVYLREGALDAARPDHPSNRRKIEAWKKLPVWTTRLIGPAIVRGIP